MKIMPYASKFTELSKSVRKFMPSERWKMRRFEKDLAFYICNQLAGPPIHTYQESYERVAEVERVKTTLRALDPINQKRKGIEWRAPSEAVN